jgi:hypothetical protein
MKKKLLILLAAGMLTISLTACMGEETATDSENTEGTTETETEETAREAGEIPFDYPVVATTSVAGEYVLAPTATKLEESFKEDGENSSFIFYSAKMIEPGEAESIIEDFMGEQYPMPNSLIVPIKKDQTAKVGDVVLTWWQSGSGLIKAIVTAEGKSPKARYLDVYMEEEETLKADSFQVLTGALEPGASVAVNGEWGYEHAVAINISGDKVLVMGFAGIMEVVDKDDVVVIPTSIDVAVGDTIMAPVIATYEEVVVTAVDEAIGQITAEYEWAGEMTEEVFVMGEVTTSL